MENPCKNCPKQGCGSYHDICPEYIEWKKQELERRNLIKKNKAFHGREYIADSVFKHRTHGAFKCKKKERKNV